MSEREIEFMAKRLTPALFDRFGSISHTSLVSMGYTVAELDCIYKRLALREDGE
jgi:hypothetical protein